MQLDDVVSSVAAPDSARFAEAAERSIRWLDRCIAAHARPTEQSLFAIAQGVLRVCVVCDIKQVNGIADSQIVWTWPPLSFVSHLPSQTYTWQLMAHIRQPCQGL